MTYVTGAHAFKAGINDNWGDAKQINASLNPLTSYTFTRGVPTAFAVNSDPTGPYTNIPMDFGAFVQDKWTRQRVTVSGGLRFDAINAYAPEQHYGPAPLLPNRDITFPKTDFTGLRDLNPRLGFAMDVFGTGKTAVKASLNRYVQDRSLSGVNNLVIGSPVSYYQSTATRSWTDSNGNFYPDCNWANGAAQNLTASGGDICGAWTGANANFGKTASGTVNDREVDFGWRHRQYNWEYSTSVQQELVPGKIAVDVGYYRRWFGNFNTTDNLTTAASDYSPFYVVVPTDSRLPLSGQRIGPFYDPNPDVASLPTNNHVRLADNYGKQFEYWHGIDATTAVRLSGTVVQGGYSTGRRVTDNCEIASTVPETSTVAGMGALLNINGPLVGPFCHQEERWQHQFKMFGTYMVPRIAVQFAAAFQSIPGPMLTATLPVPSATVQTIGGLGRPLAGNAANVTVNVIQPGTAVRRPPESDRSPARQSDQPWRRASCDRERRPVQCAQQQCGPAGSDDVRRIQDAGANHAGTVGQVHSRREFLTLEQLRLRRQRVHTESRSSGDARNAGDRATRGMDRARARRQAGFDRHRLVSRPSLYP